MTTFIKSTQIEAISTLNRSIMKNSFECILRCTQIEAINSFRGKAVSMFWCIQFVTFRLIKYIRIIRNFKVRYLASNCDPNLEKVRLESLV